MWFTPAAFARIYGAVPTGLSAAETKAKKEAEDIINEAGRGICMSCDEEIVKNERLGCWESEFLLEYCHQAKDRKHKPLIRYSSEGEVENVAPDPRDDTPDAEPVPGFWGLG